MTNAFPKYTGGAFGPSGKPLTFDHINRITDATEVVERSVAPKAGAVAGIVRSLVVELLEEEGTIGTRPYWSWRAVGVSSGSAAIATQTGLLESSLYDTDQGGYAISLDGGGAAGDVVTIHELPGFDAKRWFVFGGGSASAAVFALQIDTVDGADFPYTYNVNEGLIDGTGAFVATGNTGVMYNLWEYEPFGHGQATTFATGTLEYGPLEGTAFGGLSMIDGTVRVYICDVPCPVAPVCSEGAAVAASVAAPRRSNDVMRNGL